MKCYVINLDRSVDRFRHMSSQLSGTDAPIVRIPAVDGTQISSAVIARWQARCRVWTPMTAQEIGCFLSHRDAWKAISEDDAEWAFVCEDDIHTADDFGCFVGSDSWVPEDADIIKAETMRSRIRMSRTATNVAFFHNVRRLLSEHTGSAGYFVSRTAAKAMLRASEERCEPVDRLLFSPGIMAGRFAIYQLDPAICIQDHRLVLNKINVGFSTEIPEKKELRKKSLFRKISKELFRPLRKLSRFLYNISQSLNFFILFKTVNIKIKGKIY